MEIQYKNVGYFFLVLLAIVIAVEIGKASQIFRVIATKIEAHPKTPIGG